MCEKQGITGKNITPFVLSEVSRLTKGLSMETSKNRKQTIQLSSFYILFIYSSLLLFLDISLLKNNSLIGSKIALEYYSKLCSTSKSVFEIKKSLNNSRKSPVRILKC